MLINVFADIVVIPLYFPAELNLRYDTVDQATLKSTGHAQQDYRTYTLSQVKRRFPIDGNLWPEYEARLANGEAVVIAREHVRLENIEDQQAGTSRATLKYI